MMPAITISRTLGSWGSQVAQSLADHLGYRLVGREVINEAACHACTPEVALAMIDELGLLNLRPSARAYRAYLQAVRNLVTELAAKGQIVILGRAGQVILKDDPQALHVRIVAPMAERVERLVKRQQIPPSAAQARIKKSDTTRAAYLKRNYSVDWNDPLLYDLIINTQHISISLTIALIDRVWQDRVSGASAAPDPPEQSIV